MSDNIEYKFATDDFSKIPGFPFAYWVSDSITDLFSHKSITEWCSQKTRISTGNNDLFMRFWFEIDKSKEKWVLCIKGGEFRKWYGNYDLVIDWGNNGQNLRSYKKAMLGDISFFFKKGLTWTVISSKKSGFRIVPSGAICDHKGPLIYVNNDDNSMYLLGLLNSKIAEYIFQFTAPTMGLEWGAIAKMPLIEDEESKDIISSLVNENIETAKIDWDSFETSSEFAKHPLL